MNKEILYIIIRYMFDHNFMFEDDENYENYTIKKSFIKKLRKSLKNNQKITRLRDESSQNDNIKSFFTEDKKQGFPVFNTGGKTYYLSTNKSYKGSKKTYIKNKKIYFIPNILKERITMYVCGPSGVGKTTFIKNVCKKLDEINKKRFKKGFSKYLLSKKNKDVSIDGLKNLVRFDIDVKNPIKDLSNYKNSIFIFDDYENILDKKEKRATHNLLNTILNVGRDQNLNCIISSHLINKNYDSRNILNEVMYVVIYPKSGCDRAIKYYLDNYLMMKKDMIQKILDCDSRYVILHKSYPMCAITENEAFIIE